MGYVSYMPLTLERIPHEKQVSVHGLLAQGFPYRKISKLCDVSIGVIGMLAKRQPANLSDIDTFKKGLIARAYAIGGQAFNYVTDDKLNACSAPQLMMVAGIAVDKARDMEGSNRPVFNVVTVINECKQTREKLERQMLTIERAEQQLIGSQTPSEERSDLR